MPLHSSKDYAPLADEVNPPFGNIAPAPTVSRNGTIVYSKRISPPGSGPSSEDEHRGSNGSGDWSRTDDDMMTIRGSDRKGKGRAHYPVDEDAVDIGDRHAHRAPEARYGRGDGYDVSSIEGGSSYPPLSEVEEEEKRVQANLAKFTARETARRKAARLSKALPSSDDSRRNSSAGSSSSSLSRKRTSIFGYVGTLVGVKEDPPAPRETELPTIAQTQAYTNPYDSQPSSSNNSPSRPTMQQSSPFADPSDSARSSPTRAAPVDARPGDFGYAGPAWRGGDAPVNAKPEKWWHSLCAWGNDLDGGHGNNDQAGRTNPLE